MFDLFSGEAEVIFSCGLLLSLPEEASAISLSSEVAAHNAVHFVLNRERRPPFIRMYEFLLPKKNVDRAIQAIQNLETGMSSFRIDWGEVEETSQFIAIWVKLNEPLLRLHRAILLALNPLREGSVKEKYQSENSQQSLSTTELQSLRAWGSPWADPYIPHMIIAKAISIFTTEVDVEWEYEHSVTRGLVFGTKEEDGEFLDMHTLDFASK